MFQKQNAIAKKLFGKLEYVKLFILKFYTLERFAWNKSKSGIRKYLNAFHATNSM